MGNIANTIWGIKNGDGDQVKTFKETQRANIEKIVKLSTYLPRNVYQKHDPMLME